jgi:hypothetical protein
VKNEPEDQGKNQDDGSVNGNFGQLPVHFLDLVAPVSQLVGNDPFSFPAGMGMRMMLGGHDALRFNSIKPREKKDCQKKIGIFCPDSASNQKRPLEEALAHCQVGFRAILRIREKSLVNRKKFA